MSFDLFSTKSLYADMEDIEQLMRGTPAPDNLPVSQTTSPYWDIMRTIPGNAIDWKYRHMWYPDCLSSYLRDNPIDRYALCAQYSYAIPDPASLAFVAEHLAPRAVELGCGSSYWAWQMSQLGVDIVAYDAEPPNEGANFFHNRDNKPGITVWHPVLRGTPEVLVQHADRTLFLCWPPMSDMALECLQHYQGKRLVSIGEGHGGCTGDDAFYEKLDAEWNEIAEHTLVQWSGIHDYATVYERNQR